MTPVGVHLHKQHVIFGLLVPQIKWTFSVHMHFVNAGVTDVSDTSLLQQHNDDFAACGSFLVA